MNLGKTPNLIIFALLALFVGCSERQYLEYSEATELFKVEMGEAEVLEVFGEPASVMEDEFLTTWYYDHIEMIEHLERGGEVVAFKINFKEGRSYSIQEIIITKRAN
jgi:hypothetical protein